MQRLFNLQVALLLLATLMLWTTGCSTSKTVGTLPHEGALNLKLTLDPKTRVPVSISGLANTSDWHVNEVRVVKDGSTLNVSPLLVPLQPGQSGTFSTPLQVTDDINEIRFGAGKYLIWHRQSGSTASLPASF